MSAKNFSQVETLSYLYASHSISFCQYIVLPFKKLIFEGKP